MRPFVKHNQVWVFFSSELSRGPESIQEVRPYNIVAKLLIWHVIVLCPGPSLKKTSAQIKPKKKKKQAAQHLPVLTLFLHSCRGDAVFSFRALIPSATALDHGN